MSCQEDTEKFYWRHNPPLPKDDLITVSRQDILSLMSDEDREEFLRIESEFKRLDKALCESKDPEQQTLARKGFRQPRKKRSKKTGGRP